MWAATAFVAGTRRTRVSLRKELTATRRAYHRPGRGRSLLILYRHTLRVSWSGASVRSRSAPSDENRVKTSVQSPPGRSNKGPSRARRTTQSPRKARRCRHRKSFRPALGVAYKGRLACKGDDLPMSHPPQLREYGRRSHPQLAHRGQTAARHLKSSSPGPALPVDASEQHVPGLFVRIGLNCSL